MDAGAVLHLRAAAPPQRRQGPGQQNIFIKPLKIFYKKYFPCAAWRGAEAAGLAAGEDPGAEADTGERGPGQEVAHTQPRAGVAALTLFMTNSFRLLNFKFKDIF